MKEDISNTREKIQNIEKVNNEQIREIETIPCCTLKIRKERKKKVRESYY